MAVASKAEYLAIWQMKHDVLLALSWLDRIDSYRRAKAMQHRYFFSCKRKLGLSWRMFHGDKERLG